MHDNLDGSYYYNYSLNLDGNITISVLLYSQGLIYSEYFDNSIWSGTPSVTSTISTLNLGWTGAITSLSDYVTARYWLAIRAPTTATVTIYVEVDDTVKIYVSDVVLINNGYGNFSNTLSMIDNQYYTVRIDFSENTGDAEVRLSWSYGSVAKEIIPSTYLFYPTYVASSPYQVVASCPTGYTGYDINSTEACNEIDGDGLRVGAEQCDDGNVVNGDGCNSVQVIEDDYTCDLGSSTRKDICYECTAGFEQNSDKSECIISDYSNGLIIFVSCLAFCVLAGIKISIATAIVKNRYPNTIFMFIEQLQILQLIKVISVFYPKRIMLFFYMLRHVWLQFDFVDLETRFHGAYFYDRYDLEMRILGFRSQSAIINLTNWIFIWPLVLIFYFFVYFFLEYLIYYQIKGVLLSPLRKLVNWMLPGLFIRIFNFSFTLLVFLSFHELNRYEYNSKYRWSWWMAFLIIFICAIYGVGVLVSTLFVIFKPALRNHIYLSEFFSGLRDKSYSSFYLFATLLQRTMLVVFAVINFDSKNTEILGYFL